MPFECCVQHQIIVSVCAACAIICGCVRCGVLHIFDVKLPESPKHIMLISLGQRADDFLGVCVCVRVRKRCAK